MPIVVPSLPLSPVDDPLSATGLVRELGYRLGELALSTPTAAGSLTTLVDTSLNQHLPADVDKLGCWVYGAESVANGNQGSERRARSWNKDTSSLTFWPPGWPQAVDAAGVYEVHMRTRRARKLAAINGAVGQLYLYWYRDFMFDDLRTAQNTWKYPLPDTILWSGIYRLEVEATKNDQLLGYPYLDGREFDWRYESQVDAAGVRSSWIQFGIQPPPDRIIRMWAQGYSASLTHDGDRLALDGKWQGAAREWIFDYAEYLIDKWESSRQPAGQADRYRIMSLDRLNAMKEDLLRLAPPHKPSPIIVPGKGDAIAFPRWAGSEYLGAYEAVSH
jgi:hypothetical protein